MKNAWSYLREGNLLGLLYAKNGTIRGSNWYWLAFFSEIGCA